MPPKSRLSLRIIAFILVVFTLLNAALLILQTWPMIQTGQSPLLNLLGTKTIGPPIPTSTATPGEIIAEVHAETPVPTPLPVRYSDPEGLEKDGIIILAMRDGSYSHLFAYHPLYLSLTRLTTGDWDDQSPDISPDGTKVAFSSRKNGYWDLYVLDLRDHSLTQVTDTPEYDGSPSWSPDNQWLTYETYQDSDLEIAVRSTADLAQEAILLTDNTAMDGAPAWSPQGRSIAFVSDRSGNMEIWTAQLDQVDDRFTNISQNSQGREREPAWSPDGRYLVWAAEKSGSSELQVWDSQNPDRKPVPVGTGRQPVWSPDGRRFIAELHSPTETGLIGYEVPGASVVYPATRLPGNLYGMDWKAGELPTVFSGYPLPENATVPTGELYEARLSLNPMPPGGRFGIVQLTDISAPYPYLNDNVDESFNNLRRQIGIETGWDFLSSLEQAYFPLTEPPIPGTELNWLLTGRAIAVNSMPVTAGWMVTIKEEFEGQVYWRLYLKARFQDGSMGKPLIETPWDHNARYLSDPVAFEAGGRDMATPAGYWIDFTELASRYNWQRIPSLSDWRTYFPSIRFNQYVLSDGLDWNSAMAEVYPPEALVTSTFIPTPTVTASETPEVRVTPTATATNTLTPTLNPTFTPKP